MEMSPGPSSPIPFDEQRAACTSSNVVTAVADLLREAKVAHTTSGHEGDWVPYYAEYLVFSGQIEFFSLDTQAEIEDALRAAAENYPENPDDWPERYAGFILSRFTSFVQLGGPSCGCQH